MARADKKSFIVYHDWEDAFLSLDTDEERAQLCMAMFSYAIRREVPEDLSPKLRFGFQFIKRCMDRDFEKYEAICRENALRGALGGEAKKRNSMASGSERQRTLTNVADNGKEKGKEKAKANGRSSPQRLGDILKDLLPSPGEMVTEEQLRESYGNEAVNCALDEVGKNASMEELARATERHSSRICQYGR